MLYVMKAHLIQLPSAPLALVVLMFFQYNLLVSRDVTEFESESQCCYIPIIFCKSEICQIFRHIRIRIELSFWKALVHSLQSAVNHTKVNKCTVNSYLLTSVETKYQIGPELLVRFGV